MGKSTILDAMREGVARFSLCLFLWAIEMTEEQYLNAIYEQERGRRGHS